MAILEKLDVHVRVTGSVVTTTVPPHFGIAVMKADPAISLTTSEDTVSDGLLDCFENKLSLAFQIRTLTERWIPQITYYDNGSTEDRNFWYLTGSYKPSKAAKKPLGGACSDEHLAEDQDRSKIFLLVYVYRGVAATSLTANATAFLRIRVRLEERWAKKF
jgi:hypothetical protein